MSLRVDPVRGVVLVLPSRARLSDARIFLRTHRDWLIERLHRLPQSIALTPGATVPLLGQDHLIRHHPEARRGVWRQDGEIHVSGHIDHVPRRVVDFLKAEARRLMVAKAHELAARIDRKPSRISVKDTVSRWGSCSAQGAIALSWRLVMAPDWVATYVVGHEVAHLVELNHSPAFWAVVTSLGVDHHGARTWLKTNGAHLHRYQAE
ncbi:M48 family metallopeptidase [Magnetospirillum sp. J10]|uniref:M48 family metallopeptidase n=2 Tax=Magnetospirillum sulfuroxidans TaxID=611300 RepID=A0ABS5IDU2_9PROT|nr:SprT family zinc-dependent metalloprotease [Magnetospirillum sulfuroxidans]MBR9972599.1 M48 family metallopeptidase [Magnetospirillum sulfuroxidans]